MSPISLKTIVILESGLKFTNNKIKNGLKEQSNMSWLKALKIENNFQSVLLASFKIILFFIHLFILAAAVYDCEEC